MRDLIYFFLCINGAILLIFLMNNDTNLPLPDNLSIRNLWPTNATQIPKTQRNPFEQCIYPNFNPYSKETKKNINLWRNDDVKCGKEFVNTKLQKNKIYPLGKDKFCFGRCITRNDDWSNKIGEWLPAKDTTFECDFVEAGCSSRNDVKTLRLNETDMHMQINKIDQIKNSTKHKYNVLIFAIDSQGATQAYRNMPKSLTFMKKGLEAVEFPHVNKVGRNTRPNMIPIIYGKSLQPIDKTIFGLGIEKEDWVWEEQCKTFMDNETDLFEEFKKDGYIYMTADDWVVHLLGWPDCVGTKKQVPHHTLQAYIRELKKGPYSYNRTERFCGARDARLPYKFSQKFLDAYIDEPKLIFSVVTGISHGSQDGSVNLDTDFYDFLWRNQEVMEKSFVIWMSDHGLRFGRGVNTPLGQYELSNPMLYISVPKELRNTGILEIMKENAGKLQTHWDTRATLIDILKHQPLTNFSSRETLQMPGERGNSYFRKQVGERTCRTLPIPFEYCTCQYEMETLDPKSEESRTVGKAVINHINNLFVTRNVTKDCARWKFGKVIEISAYVPRNVTNSYKLQVGASEPYDKAVFSTIVNRKGQTNFSVGSIDRLDSYGKRGDCQKTDLQQLCDCKKQ